MNEPSHSTSVSEPNTEPRFGLVGRVGTGLAVVGIGAGVIWLASSSLKPAVAGHDSGSAHQAEEDQRVEVVSAEAGGPARSVSVPGTVRAFDYASLFARVSGFLKTQSVDIGDRVQKGQLLAELDVPELVEELQRRRAEQQLAEAQLKQTDAAIQAALAESEVAVSTVRQAQAEVGRTTAAKTLRGKQYARFSELRGMKAIDERLVDEKQDEHEAAVSAYEAAIAKVATAQAQVIAASAKVEQARADQLEAKAKVTVAQAEVQKAQVLVDFSKIVSPYEGVVTERNFHVGDFISSADKAGSKAILQVQKVDTMRLVVQVPDLDIAFLDVGDLADFRIDGLGSASFEGRVSRYANSEDERTRTMRTEIDVKNPEMKFRDGMYGQVRIHLQDSNPKSVTVPSACLMGSVKRGDTKVFVCQNGKLKLTPVRVGMDDGVQAEITQGLEAKSQVVYAPGGDLTDGAKVEAIPHVASAAH